MKDLKGKVAVITGAGSGIGRSLAGVLAAEGAHLALSDVNEATLRETVEGLSKGDVKVTSHRLDVADRAAVHAHADEVLAAHGQVDIVINNAGVAVVQNIEDVSYEDFEWVMGINFWGVVYGTKAFLPHLKTRPEASIVNISSVNAFLPFPFNGPYNCSKYAVCGFSETLHQELAETKVRVSSVHPGGIKTNIAKNARMHVAEGGDVEQMERGRQNLEKAFLTSPEKAAGQILRAVQMNSRRALIGPDAHVFNALARLPAAAYQRLVGLGARRTM
ncbi:MAG: SDR family oxidoreductase [Myxococcales bacterium]|nr:SDR family oxidoreductase [Myxococcales bacterium]